MNELKPLLESSPNPATRRLLRAALPDKPPSDARRRTAITLRVGTTAAVAAASGGAAAGSGAAALSAATGASTGMAITAAKWLAGGLVMGSLVSGGAALVGDPSSRTGPASVTSSAVASVPRASVSEARPSHAFALAQPAHAQPSKPDRTPASSTAEKSASPNARTTRRATAKSGLPAALAAVPSSVTRGLGREIALIDAARRAVARGDANGAMSQLDHYNAVRETQILDREARLLRIDVLVLRGEREGAAVLAREYLRQLPNDPHSGRLRKLLQP